MLLCHLIASAAQKMPDFPALGYKSENLDYKTLLANTEATGRALLGLGLAPRERVAVYLEKRPETVLGLFGAAWAGGVFVPVNPILKAPQVLHILSDCNARIMVTSKVRLGAMADMLSQCPDLTTVLLVDAEEDGPDIGHIQVFSWVKALAKPSATVPHPTIDTDMAAILYTSGSTGRPKGVVLSHRNMVAGALSVSEYLENTAEDRLLAVLPLSFDYGLSQLTTAFAVGAKVVLLNHLLPRDVVKAVVTHRITGLAAVPPLWMQLADLQWPEGVDQHLRYMTNSGGAMPGATLQALRQHVPNSRFFLMYGLTEAFRSTYLAPEEIDRRPNSMGKAIPNADILVVRPDGTRCDPGEPGELVHRGALVGLGYWKDPERTAERYRPAPGQPDGLPLPEMAVWSGDTVRMDEEGFLYFVGRKDEMIKTSGYRVSPTEVEELASQSGMVAECVAMGVAHPTLGQGTVLVVFPRQPDSFVADELLRYFKSEAPAFMVPAHINVAGSALPRNANGKIDRKLLHGEFQSIFKDMSQP